jgi:S-adenosylmethionine:tRNA ribosyltransferase-isomerase
MDIRDFDFALPPELIAQEPAARPTDARLLRLDRASGATAHHTVAELPSLLQRGDLLVVNDSRVFPARLLGRRVPSGGAAECLLVTRVEPDVPLEPGERGSSSEALGEGAARFRAAGEPVPTAASESGQFWEALVHPGQKLKVGARLIFEGPPAIHGEIVARRFFGRRIVRLWTADGSPIDAAVDAIGHAPLPPYIKRGDRPCDRERYQTMFAARRGSIAAPTAGLHFTATLVEELARRGVERAAITLHVGYGTFQPVRVARVEDHRLEAEWYAVTPDAADRINAALDDGRRIVAVGTTATRTLEAAARAGGGRVTAGTGRTDLFIYPGFEFRVVRGLLTNFHLPQSSLLLLVAAFAGRDRVLHAYAEAIAARYRFYSYGDAMLIL